MRQLQDTSAETLSSRLTTLGLLRIPVAASHVPISRECRAMYVSRGETTLKYICKGSDRVIMQIVVETGNDNEIQQFQDARCVSAAEAAWRILAYDIVDNDPSVYLH